MGLLLAICFAGGIAAVGTGVFTDAHLPDGGDKLKRFLKDADVDIAPVLFLLGAFATDSRRCIYGLLNRSPRSVHVQVERAGGSNRRHGPTDN